MIDDEIRIIVLKQIRIPWLLIMWAVIGMISRIRVGKIINTVIIKITVTIRCIVGPDVVKIEDAVTICIC